MAMEKVGPGHRDGEGAGGESILALADLTRLGPSFATNCVKSWASREPLPTAASCSEMGQLDQSCGVAVRNTEPVLCSAKRQAGHMYFNGRRFYYSS